MTADTSADQVIRDKHAHNNDPQWTCRHAHRCKEAQTCNGKICEPVSAAQEPSAEALGIVSRITGKRGERYPSSVALALEIDAFAARKVADAQTEWARYDDAIREQERARCEAIVQRYIDNPASGPQNNTQEAFDAGMNHEAGAIDSASAILAAIRSLPDNA